MQYKRFRRARKAAAVILSAALMFTDLPQADMAYAAQISEGQTQEASETESSAAQESSPTGEGSSSENSSSSTESSTEGGHSTEEVPSAEENSSTGESSSSENSSGSTESSAPQESGTQESGSMGEGHPTEEGPSTGEGHPTEESSEAEESGSIEESSAAEESGSMEKDPSTEEVPSTEESGSGEEGSTSEISTDLEESTETETATEQTEETETVIPVPVVDTDVYSPGMFTQDTFNVRPQSVSVHYETTAVLTADADGNYNIGSKDEFLAFLKSPGTYADKTVNLNCDVDMEEETAYFDAAFKGTFHGNGHSVYNVKISTGLFKSIENNAMVEKLHVSGVTISGSGDTGIITGTNRGKISDCAVTGTLVAEKDAMRIAGIAATNNGGTISGCVFAGSITATGEHNSEAKYIGGIAGENSGEISGCRAVGSISTNASAVAGIAAENVGSINNCANYMNISAAYAAGGIVFESRGTISGCSNYGSIEQKDSGADGTAGGIAGGNRAEGIMENCVNYGIVSGNGNNIAGIAGYSSGSVTGCGNLADIKGMSNVGGIVGQYCGTEKHSISHCFNKGGITGKGTTDAKGVGGILGSCEYEGTESGKNYEVGIDNCYNTGKMEVTSYTNYVGGIAGILKYGSINNCYSVGEIAGVVSSETDKRYGGMIAGFLGTVENATYADCVYLSGGFGVTCNRETGAEINEGAAKTAGEMKSDAVLAVLGGGFAADSGNINGGFPVLDRQTTAVYRYPVVYDLNGGCMDRYFDMADSGQTVAEPAVPVKTNGKFTGWYLDKQCGGESLYAFSRPVTAPIVVYAGWEEYVAVEDVKLSQDRIELIKGEENYKINVIFTPSNAENTEIEWKSDNEDVATVKDGYVTAHATGKATIKGRLINSALTKELALEVTVTDVENVVRFRLDGTDVFADNVSVAVGPANIRTVEAVFAKETPAGSKVQWSSSNSGYVNCAPRSDTIGTNKADLTGIKPTKDLSDNRVIVTCTLIYPDNKTVFIGRLDVTVLPQATKINIMLGAENATDKKATYDLVTKKFVAIDSTKLKKPVDAPGVSVLPSDASQKVEWTSSAESVMAINKETGAVVGNKAGKDTSAVITAFSTDGSKASDGKTALGGNMTVLTRRIVQELKLTAQEIDKTKPVARDEFGRIILTGGSSVRLAAEFTPEDATEDRIKWTFSRQNVISMDADTRIVTAKDVTVDTVVTVTGTSFDVGGASGEIEFIVKPKVDEVRIYKADDMTRCVNDKKIGINPNKDSMVFTLKAKNFPENAPQLVTWKSGNKEVATVEDNKDGSCKVTVKKVGTALITATAADGSGVYAVTTVNVSSLATQVSITGSGMVTTGSSIPLKAEVYPKSATGRSVTWESLMPDVASVDSAGKVTGKKSGLAVIIATAADGSGVSASHSVHVTDKIKTFDIKKYDDNTITDDDVVLTGKSVGIDPDISNGTGRLAMRILPVTACQEVTWKSGNEKVATVEDGVITAVGLGTATITATAADGSGKTAKVKVVVTTLVKSVQVTGSHYVGTRKTIQLKAEVGDRDAANKNVIWTSKYPDIASVSETGEVTAVAESGRTVITAEAADGSGSKAEHVVYVFAAKNNVDIAAYNDSFSIEKNNAGKKTADIDMAETETVILRAGLSGGSEIADAAYAKRLKWTSSDKTVATVGQEFTDNGGTVKITFLKAGKVTITATTTDGFSSKDTCTFTVKNKNPKVAITGPMQVARGKKIQLSAGSTDVEWSSSDPSVAAVNEKGQVKGKKNGDVTITARACVGKNSATYNVSVRAAVSKVDIVAGGNTVTNQKLRLDIVKEYNGMPLDLDAVVYGNDDDDVTWKSNKTSVAAVDQDGKITIKKNGTVTITATAKDGSGKKGKVTLVISKQVTGIEPADGTGVVYAGYKKSIQLKLAFKPLAATAKNVTWSSEDKSVVSVSKTGKITAKKYINTYAHPDGYVKVKATAVDNSDVFFEFKVYVTPPVKKVVVAKQGYEYSSVVGLDIDTNDSRIQLYADLTDTTNNLVSAQKVTWKSANKKIAEIDENGVVTGIATGKTTITATATDGSKKSGKVTLYVGSIITEIMPDDDIADGIDLVKGKSITIAQRMTVLPFTATNTKYTYKSTNKKVATVNSKGKITAKGAGTCDIIVTTTDGSNLSTTVTVNVTKK